MVLRKITDQEYKKIIADLRNLGNPEITRIMAIYKEKIKKYKELLNRFITVEESAWYLYRYDSHESGGSKQWGDKTWDFVKMLRIADTGKEPHDDYIHNDYHNPDFACLKFVLTIDIPYFKGSNLVIPEGKKIRYDYGSSWDLHLVPPLFNDRNDQRTRSERLDFTTSLHAIDNMFDVDNHVKAYIIQKFEEYRRYYQILSQLA